MMDRDDRGPLDGGEERRAGGPSYTCEVCGAAMVERHCKIVCPRCGYQRDCSDP